MRVIIKRGHSLVNDLHFESGPLYIGREARSHICLPDRAVSRRHAVLTTDADGQWLVQDLDSVNHTTLNGVIVAKMALHEGDVVGVGEFTIEIYLEDARLRQRIREDVPVDLGDTMVDAHTPFPAEFQINRDSDHPLNLLPTRVSDFYQLALMLFAQTDEEAMIAKLAKLLIEQFGAYHAWLGLRETNSGPLTCHGGCMSDGSLVSLEHLGGRKIINQAVTDEMYILLPNTADLAGPADSCTPDLARLRSAMAAPIIAPAGAFGIIYVDNAHNKAPYTPQDLDYLTLVSILVAALSEHIG